MIINHLFYADDLVLMYPSHSRKVKSFQEILRNVVYKFRCRLVSSENELIKGTLFRHISSVSKLRRHWNRLLLPNGTGDG